MTIFRDSSPNTVSLNVKVLALDVPAFGVSMT
ncbi:UDP-N-acetylglucosamine acyltransferase, partial [Escherichia coli]